MANEFSDSPEGEGHSCPRGDGSCAMWERMASVRVVRSDELLQGKRELFILHEGQLYRLLRTRKGKLILQK